MKLYKNPIGKKPAWYGVLASALLFAFAGFSTHAWAQGKTLKMPVQRPKTEPSAGIPEKKVETDSAKEFSSGMDYEMEMKKLEALIQLNDRSAAAYFNRARLQEYKGDLQKALQDYGKAIELDKGMKDALYNRGLVLARMKRYDEAAKDFSEVLRMDPSAADAYCNRGNVHFQMGKIDLALSDYGAGLKINPNDADLLYNRAQAYLAKGDKEAASQDLRKSAQMFHDRTRRDFPELAPQVPSALKKASLEGQVAGFLEYMPEELRDKVKGFEETRLEVDKAFLELEQKARQTLGEKVRKQGNTLAFSIVGKDPRWSEIFGPKWPELAKQNPGEPRFFYMSCEFGWKEEIKVIQQLLACLENPSFCQEATPQNSALRMKRVNGVWKLLDGKNPADWKEVQVKGKRFVEMLQWASRYLSDSRGKMADEEMLIGLAKGYMQKMMALSTEPKPRI